MSRINGGRLVAEMLRLEGITTVFSVSGGVLNPLYRACEDIDIRIIHTRHEAAATFMADGWARTTGQPGVVVTTLGPGVTNTLTGVVTAHRAASPVIVLAGQSSTATRDLDAGMSVDPIPIFSSVTKMSKTVGETIRIPEYMANAFRHSLSGSPGPVLLEFPGDVLRGDVPEGDIDLPAPNTSRAQAQPQPDGSAISAARDLVFKAERPILIAGSGVFWSGGGESLKRFVEAVGIPFFLARGGRGVIPEDHGLYFGPAYLPANPVLEEAFQATDLLISVGHRLDFDLSFGRAPALNPETKVIQIDINPTEIGRYRPVEIGIIADATAAINALTDEPCRPEPNWSTWIGELEVARHNWFNELDLASSGNSVPMHPLSFLRGIREVLPKDSVIVTSHGNIDFWADIYFRIYQPGGYLRAGQSGTLGAEIPYGVAAKLAHPDKPVVVIVGDGGFGYHGFELDTAARYDVPLVVAIGNDSSWGAIALPQEREYGHSLETGLQFRNYEKIAELLGGYGEFVESSEEVSGALIRALESKLPSVLNVRIDSIESRYMEKI